MKEEGLFRKQKENPQILVPNARGRERLKEGELSTVSDVSNPTTVRSQQSQRMVEGDPWRVGSLGAGGCQEGVRERTVASLGSHSPQVFLFPFIRAGAGQ